MLAIVSTSAFAGDEPRPVYRFWYDESGENWVQGQLVGIGEDWFAVDDLNGVRHEFDKQGRSACDLATVTACRALQDSAALFRSSNFPGAEVELERVRNSLILNGTSVYWARMAAGRMRKVDRETQLAWDRIRQGLAGTDARFRWIVLRGMEFEIDSVVVASDASGLERIVVRDHQGQRQLVSTDEFSKVTLLPRLWDQSTYRSVKTTASNVPWSSRRGPTVRIANQVGEEELIWATVPSESGTRRLWTQPPIVQAYEIVATATKARHDADRLAMPYHRRRHERVGDAYCLVGNYAAAIQEYSSALEIEPNHGVNLLRRGFAWMNQGDLAAAEADLTNALTHAGNDQPAQFAIAECQARIQSRRALAEANDEQALGYHQTALQIIKNISDPSYLMSADQLPPPVLQSLRRLQEKEGNVPLSTSLTTVAKGDMKRRADVWLVGGLQFLITGKPSLAIDSVERARRYALGQNSVIAPAREIAARSFDQQAQAKSNPTEAAKLYQSAFDAAREAAKEDEFYWRSAEIASAVRQAFQDWRTKSNDEQLEHQLRVAAHRDFSQRAEKKCQFAEQQIAEAEQTCQTQGQVGDAWKSPEYLQAIGTLAALATGQQAISAALADADSIMRDAGSFAMGVTPPLDSSDLLRRAQVSREHNKALPVTIERSLVRVEDHFSGFLMRSGDLTSAVNYGTRSILRAAAVGK